MKNRILEALLKELEIGLTKEAQSILELGELIQKKDVSTIKTIEVTKAVAKDSGYTNGLMEAIDIVKRIKED